VRRQDCSCTVLFFWELSMTTGFEHEVLARLPLSEAVLLLTQHTTTPPLLNDLFDRHRGDAYARELSFATLTTLVGDALLQHQGSGRQSFQRARDRGELTVSNPAAYKKLGRLPLPVSEAFLAESTQRLLTVLPAPPSDSSLPAGDIVVVDGKVIKRVPKRLRPLWGCPGGVLGGKALVALNLRTRLAVAMATDPDGHTNEAKLVPALLPQVRAHLPAVLWLVDAQFGNPQQIAAFTERSGDHVVARYDGKSQFTADPELPAQVGLDPRGRRYEESWGWLGGPRNRHRRRVRRVLLHRPGAEAVVLVTDLMDAAAHPATEILAVYLQRWGIERVFQEITEVFALKRLIGTSPQGTVFQLALCLWWYNVIQVIRAYVAVGAGQAVERVSSELLFADVQRQLIALYELLPSARVGAVWAAPWVGEELQQWLAELLSPLWTDRWRKAPPKKKQTRPPTVKKRASASAHRLLEKHRRDQRQLIPK
jgi:hypothetical protein